MKKTVISLLALIAIATSLIACHQTAKVPQDAIPVLSNYRNLSYLTPGDYDESKFDDITWKRYGYTTYVTNVDGALAVMPAHTHGSSADPYVYRNETFAFENVLGCKSGIYLNGEKIIDEECVAILHSDLDCRMLVFTTAKNRSCIYEFTRSNRDEDFQLSNNQILFDSKMHLVYFTWPNQFYSSPSTVYVITANNVTILDTTDYMNTREGDFSSIDSTVLTPPSWWEFVKPNNATLTEDGTVFIGEREGVIGIAPDGTITYYPIDYQDAMREEPNQ